MTDSSLKYKGVVNIKVMKDNKVIKSYHLHNNGSWNLFHFMGLSLQGRYSEAELYRPQYIRLFDFGVPGGEIPTSEEIYDLLNPAHFASLSEIGYNTTPKETLNTYLDGKSTVTFKFLIPFTQISGDVVNGLALYNNTNKTSYNQPCAYVVVKNSEGKLGSLVNTSSSYGYNLFVEWKLIIENEDKQ